MYLLTTERRTWIIFCSKSISIQRSARISLTPHTYAHRQYDHHSNVAGQKGQQGVKLIDCDNQFFPGSLGNSFNLNQLHRIALTGDYFPLRQLFDG